jgi:hypothetical protein
MVFPRDHLEVARGARSVEYTRLAFVDKSMCLAIDLEVVDGRISREDWRVDQHVVVCGAPAVGRTGERG